MTLKTTARLALVLILSATALSACGRKGDLEPPGMTPAAKSSAADSKKQVAEDKPFFLDFLL